MATQTKNTTTKATTKTPKIVKKTTPTSSKTMAVIRTGSKQYIVRVGDILKIEKIFDEDIKAGKIVFDDVLLVDDGKQTKVGTPKVSGSKVVAEVVDQIKDKKVVVIRYRAKSRYFKKRGHRQEKTFVKITEIK
jgi:large subunit ribosomal protein L21